MPGYVALLRQKTGNDYRVSFPDLPGCVARGSSLVEARKNAAEELSHHLEGMVESGLTLPVPTPLERTTGDDADVFPVLVKVPDPYPRVAKLNITLPVSILNDVDARAKQLGTSRSQFLSLAAQNQIYARVVVREDEVRSLEGELLRNDFERRQQILALLRKWRDEPDLVKDTGVDSLIDRLLKRPPTIAANAAEPYVRIRRSRVTQRKTLKPDDLERLVAATRRDPKPMRGLRDRALLAVLAGGGLRRSEVARLTTSDFDRELRTLRVVSGGNRERRVPLPQWDAAAIAEFVDSRGFQNGPLICRVSQPGVALREGLTGGQAVYIVLRRLALRAGMKDVPPLAFRRNYCTQLLDRGANLPAVQELLGVAAVQRLYNYSPELERLTGVVDRLPNPGKSD